MSNSSVLLPDFILDLLNDIAKQEGFTDFSIDIGAGSNHADGFLGIISNAKINGTRNNKIDQLSLMLKLPPSNAVRRETFSADPVFKREIYSYTKFLPAINEFQRKKGLTNETGFFSYPKCYATVNDDEHKNYALILEDLRARQFVMWNKLKTIDLEHVLLVLTELGRYHGVSFAFRDQNSDLYKELADIKDIFYDLMTNDATDMFRKMSYDRCIAALDPVADKEIIVKMANFRDHYNDELRDCLNAQAAEPYTVFNHGDCWSNNMMFTYSEASDKPNEICFLDWQLLRISSPVLDIVYFLFTSTHKPLRDAHYETMLKTYYNALANTIRQAGSDPEKIFTYTNLTQQLKQFGKFALLMAPMLLQVITADPKDIPDIDEMAEQMAASNNQNTDIINMEKLTDKKTQMSYNIRVADVVRDVISYGYY